MKNEGIYNEITSSENYLAGLEIDEYNVKVYLTYIGSERVNYKMFWKDELLFSGDDYKPSPLYNQDSIEAVVSLLDFLTLQEGDVERDYFKNYTEKQIEWRESKDCEDLKYLVLDFENDNDDLDETDAHHDARRFMQDKFVQ